MTNETTLAFAPLDARAAASAAKGDPADRIAVRDYTRDVDIGAFQSERDRCAVGERRFIQDYAATVQVACERHLAWNVQRQSGAQTHVFVSLQPVDRDEGRPRLGARNRRVHLQPVDGGEARSPPAPVQLQGRHRG